MSLQLGPGPVRGPRADCYTDAHLAPAGPEALERVCMLAFGTLFSCQGAQSSHYCCQAGRRRHLGDALVTPIQSESEATRTEAPSRCSSGWPGTCSPAGSRIVTTPRG
jgi:hypothetical protein